MLERRSFVKSLAGLPLATVLATPGLARAAAAGLEDVSITTGKGRTVRAALAVPSSTPAPAVLMVHEWWGLNDQIKAVAAEFANRGYLALAIDMFDGKVATSSDEARALTGSLKPETGIDTATSWAAWLQHHKLATGKLGTVGWCFGGGWSLTTSLHHPVDATVIYYGRVGGTPEELARLKGPVLGHYGTEDRFINRAMVEAFETNMRQAGRPYTSHWYNADHAFANPTGARYDEADAALAWQRTLEFFGKELKG